MTNRRKTSFRRRYDPRTGLWVKGKFVYLYWFKFLQHATRDETRVVNWSKYPYWGGESVILSSTFEDWWKPRWKRLFGYEDPANIPEGKFMPNEGYKIDPIRIALKFYELHQTGIADNWELAKAFATDEYARRRKIAIDKGKAKNADEYSESDEARKWVFNIARRSVYAKLLEDPDGRQNLPNYQPKYALIDGDGYSSLTKKDKDKIRVVRSKVGKYLIRAEQMLDSVCEGKFP